MKFSKCKKLYIEFIKENVDDMSKLGFIGELQFDNKQEELCFYEYVYDSETSLDVLKILENKIKELKKETFLESILKYFKKFISILGNNTDMLINIFMILIMIIPIALFIHHIIFISICDVEYDIPFVMGATNEIKLCKVLQFGTKTEIKILAFNKIKITNNDYIQKTLSETYNFMLSVSSDKKNKLLKTLIKNNSDNDIFINHILFFYSDKQIENENMFLIIDKCKDEEILKSVLIIRSDDEVKKYIQKRIEILERDLK